MPTQRTGVKGNGPEGPEDNPPKDEQDLGLSEDAGNIVDDPSGFVADSPVEQVQGRRVRPISSEDLNRAHKMQAGPDVPMFGPSLTDKDGRQQERPYKKKAMPEEPKENPAARSKAESMMPGFMKGGQEGAPAPTPTAAYQQQQQQEGAPPSEQPAVAPRTPAAKAAQEAIFNESAGMIRQLLDQEAEARSRGDYQGAAQARQIAEGIAAEYDFERIAQPRKEHPGLQRLKADLGLEKIKPASISWAGYEWAFAPTNARLDGWVTANMRGDATNLAALMISAGLVAIDDIPIYDFLSIPLTEEHVVSTTDDAGEEIKQKMVVSLFRKYCTCGAQVSLEESMCFSCEALLDTYDIPTDLRLLCAERFNRFLEEEFGPYEELPLLLEMKTEAMKDRRLNKEQLFPLVMSSQEAKTTPSLQSGDES